MKELKSIQKEIEQIRIDNLKGLTQIEVDDKLYELEQRLFKAMDASDGDLSSVRGRLNDFLSKQQDIPEDIQKVINEKFWDMI